MLPRPLRASRLGTAALALALVSLAPAAGATTLDFEAPPTLSDAGAFPFPGVSIAGALVIDETNLADLIGADATGVASSGTQVLWNVYAPDGITFSFSDPVTDFAVDVVALFGAGGAPQQVLLQAFRGATLIATDVSDPARTGDSLFPEDVLSAAADGITRVVISPIALGDCGTLLCATLGPSSSFLLDDARFTAVPEPGAAALLVAGLTALALGRRREARR